MLAQFVGIPAPDKKALEEQRLLAVKAGEDLDKIRAQLEEEQQKNELEARKAEEYAEKLEAELNKEKERWRRN